MGALTLCDLTQSAGWLPRAGPSNYDLTVCSAYKWLCQPRGTAYLTMRPELVERIRPIHAGWYAGADVWAYLLRPAESPGSRRAPLRRLPGVAVLGRRGAGAGGDDPRSRPR